MINIQPEIDVKKMEEALLALQSKKANNHIDVRLPVKCRFIGFSAFTSLIQFLITWKRQDNSGRLIIGSNESISIEDIESFVKRQYGLVASTLSWESGIINSNGEDLKHLLRNENAKLMHFLHSKDYVSASRGDSINFPFFDHLESKRGLLPIVYKNQKLCTEQDFLNLTEVLLNTALKNNSILIEKFREIKDDINSIVFELFENTHKWARKSYTEQFLDPSYRGIYTTFYKLEKKNIKDYLNSPGLLSYFESLASKVDQSYKYLTFLEISVIDSGSGLAQRYAERDADSMTVSEEYQFLKECLMKNKTSHKEFSDAQGRGIGLHRTMELLDSKKGFLRIRSGRMHLYRNFLKFPFLNKESSNPNYSLQDWDTNSTIPENRPMIEGTSISIILPYLMF
ncbi:hypothetical protein KK083_04265 [Fulvivirgaceae bacterium PWU4]|uniref:ATP-binding protein n=1 Tax=Chryseosolibacter histidini TaxID=2782349 RepID=A0AAP2DGR8_9BACT|nr:hypothetical protein [Chryseosolibacter histidini]MBT1696078.1 hypothetical protein [Chryseosolibacter histidini]